MPDTNLKSGTAKRERAAVICDAGARSRVQRKGRPTDAGAPRIAGGTKTTRPSKQFFGADGAGLSSRSVAWNTPKAVVDGILGALGLQRFDLDPCAPEQGGHVPAALAYTEQQDGLNLPWTGTVFVNPPYARYVTARWVNHCRSAWAEGNCGLVVALLAARTGSGWWFDNVFRAGADVIFLRGRQRFNDRRGPAPFDSALVLWGATESQARALGAAFPSAHLVLGGAR